MEFTVGNNEILLLLIRQAFDLAYKVLSGEAPQNDFLRVQEVTNESWLPMCFLYVKSRT